MILNIQQTKHDLKNAYQITSGGKLLYSACASNLHKLGDLTICDKNGQSKMGTGRISGTGSKATVPELFRHLSDKNPLLQLLINNKKTAGGSEF